LAAAHARSEATLRQGDADFDAPAFRRQMERHIRRFGPSSQVMGWRLSDIGEFLDEDFSKKDLFPLHRLPQGAPMGQRMDRFADMALDAVRELYPEDGSEPPDEWIHVTCTGYAAPSALQTLANQRHWNERARLIHLYHMGCYASLPALRVAAGLLAQDENTRSCDLVHTEICTLHLNPSRHDPEQLVVQSLFADGYIRYSLSPARDFPAASGGFYVLAFHEWLVADSLEDIGWLPGEFGMRMTLSRQVPDRIAAVLDGFMSALASRAGLPKTEMEKAHYAIHPGGPRIVDKVAEWLDLEPRQVTATREVLFERGNMSSATLPHIWHRMLETGGVGPGELVVSLAFGPGLTVYGSLMRRNEA